MDGPDAPTDHYSVLAVGKNAGQEDVRRAFRRKAAKSHPDKASAVQKKRATETFLHLSKAAEILSDSARREQYDREQQESRKDLRHTNGVGPAPGAAGQDAFNAMQQLFDECFHSSFARASAYSSTFSSTQSSTFAFSSSGDPFNREGSGRGATEVPLSLSLEEMQRGGLKQVTVARDLADGVSGGLLTVNEAVSVRLTPGIREGTRIVLAGRGSESRGRGCAADLVLVVHEALHPRFERRGDDLHTRVALPLLQALTGEAVTVPLLDGRALRVPVVGPISPDRVFKLPGLGMPVPADTEQQQPASGGQHRCGDLYVSFRVVFPHSVTPQQKAQLQAALS